MNFPFNPAKGLIVVPTRIWGPSGDSIVQLALDTGATGTLVNWGILVFLGYDPGAAEDRFQITTGSGVEFVPRVKVKKVQALGIEYKNFPILSHTLPPSSSVDGVLGLDFFHGHRLTIDFQAGLVKTD